MTAISVASQSPALEQPSTSSIVLPPQEWVMSSDECEQTLDGKSFAVVSHDNRTTTVIVPRGKGTFSGYSKHDFNGAGPSGLNGELYFEASDQEFDQQTRVSHTQGTWKNHIHCDDPSQSNWYHFDSTWTNGGFDNFNLSRMVEPPQPDPTARMVLDAWIRGEDEEALSRLASQALK